MSRHSIAQEAGEAVEEVKEWSRWIVVKRVAITTGTATVLSALAVAGVIPDKLATRVDGWVGTGLVLVAALASAIWSQKDTTPADPKLNPTSSNGLPLQEVPPPAPGGLPIVESVTAIPLPGIDSPDADPAPEPAPVQTPAPAAPVQTVVPPTVATP